MGEVCRRQNRRQREPVDTPSDAGRKRSAWTKAAPALLGVVQRCARAFSKQDQENSKGAPGLCQEHHLQQRALVGDPSVSRMQSSSGSHAAL